MNFRSDMSSCADRPIVPMVWISETDSAKSIVDLKKSYFITRAKL